MSKGIGKLLIPITANKEMKKSIKNEFKTGEVKYIIFSCNNNCGNNSRFHYNNISYTLPKDLKELKK